MVCTKNGWYNLFEKKWYIWRENCLFILYFVSYIMHVISMDTTTYLAFILGVIIVLAFFTLKNGNFKKMDRNASALIKVVHAAIEKYADPIQAYDKENGTNYYDTLIKISEDIQKMEEDEEMTSVEFVANVLTISNDIKDILEKTNLIDKFKDYLPESK